MELLTGKIEQAPAGASGCDVNYQVTPEMAKAFLAEGYSFVIRYIPRAPHSNGGGDLSNAEATVILYSGLALMAVQHVEGGEWMPNEALGKAYGAYAAEYATEVVGIPPGVNIWLDLESVSTAAAKADVIAYCQAWCQEVAAAGFVPGIYIGWQIILNDEEAYADLSFSHYWAAYNADVIPAVRGYQMVQGTQKTVGDIPVDPDTIKTDHKGGTPFWLKLS